MKLAKRKTIIRLITIIGQAKRGDVLDREESIDMFYFKDKYSFEEIYDNYFDRVYKFLSYRVNNTEDVKDLTSEIFKKILNKISSYDSNKANLDVWIFTIARNSLYDYYRAKSRTNIISLEKVKDFFKSESNPHDYVEKKEEVDYLKSIIKKLPERERQVISYKFGAQLKNKDIAEIMGLTSSNVSVIIHRTIKELRKEMEDYYEFKWKI